MEMLIVVGVILIAIILLFIFMYFVTNDPSEIQIDPVQIAREEYSNLLEQLKTNSNNPELKSNALVAGRYYYSLCREDGALTIYDEQAILNDINAHCVNTTINTVTQENTNESSNNQIFKDIEQLASLKEKGILSEEEFLEKKKVLLKKI